MFVSPLSAFSFYFASFCFDNQQQHSTASHIGDVHSHSYCDVDGLQVIRMNVERFSIPELLFHPADIGIQEMGVAEAVVHTISQTPPGLLTAWEWFGWLCLRYNGHLPAEPGLADVILELRMMVVTTGAIRRGQRQSWKTPRWAWGKQVHEMWYFPFSTSTLLVGWHEGHPACKKTWCWFVGGDDLTWTLLQLSPPPPSSFAPINTG